MNSCATFLVILLIIAVGHNPAVCAENDGAIIDMNKATVLTNSDRQEPLVEDERRCQFAFSHETESRNEQKTVVPVQRAERKVSSKGKPAKKKF